MSKIIANTTDIPSDVVRSIAALIAPPGVTGYAMRINNSTRGGSGWAFYARKQIKVSVPEHACRYTYRPRPGTGYLTYNIGSRAEAFIFILAHELRHLWQQDHTRGKVWGSRGRFSERDADAYGLQILRAFRRGEIDGLAELAKAIPPGLPEAAWRQQRAAKEQKNELRRAAKEAMPGKLSLLPAAIRKVVPEGATFDGGEYLDAPEGWVWAATGSHSLLIGEDEGAAKNDVKEGLVKCDRPNCDVCAA